MIYYDWVRALEKKYLYPLQNKYKVRWHEDWGKKAIPLESFLKEHYKDEELRRYAREKYIFKYFLLVQLPDFISDVIHAPHRAWDYVWHLCHWFKWRFDKVDLNLPMRYYDVDFRMDRAIEQLFIFYVEEEAGIEDLLWRANPPPDASDTDIHAAKYFEKVKTPYQEMIAAYEWLTEERPELNKQVDALYKKDGPVGEERHRKYSDLADKIKAGNSKHIENIWKHRRYYWT